MMNTPAQGRDGSHAPSCAPRAMTDDRPFKVIFESARYYASPDAIVGDMQLSRAEQLRLLDDWAQDLSDRQVATAEGMLPPSPALASADAQLLGKVNAGIETIEAAKDEAIGPLARAWRRLTTD